VPPQPDRLARPQAAVGEYGEEGGIQLPIVCQEIGPHCLDRLWRERPDDSRAPLSRLADPPGGVCVEVSPLHCPLEDRLKQGERLPDRIELQPTEDDHLTLLQQLSPERRVESMLHQLAAAERRR
jgi:hypothetical protein